MADDLVAPAPVEPPTQPAPVEAEPAAAESSDERTVDVDVSLDDKGVGVIGRHAGDVRAVNGKTSGYTLETPAEGVTSIRVDGGKGSVKVTVTASQNDPE